MGEHNRSESGRGTWVAFWAHFSCWWYTLTDISENLTAVIIYRTTRRNIPEDSHVSSIAILARNRRSFSKYVHSNAAPGLDSCFYTVASRCDEYIKSCIFYFIITVTSSHQLLHILSNRTTCFRSISPLSGSLLYVSHYIFMQIHCIITY
jgi:hypothetical protein